MAAVDGSKRRVHPWLILPLNAGVLVAVMLAARSWTPDLGLGGWKGAAIQRGFGYLVLFGPLLCVASLFMWAERRAAKRGGSPTSGAFIGIVAGAGAFGAAMVLLGAVGALRLAPPAFLGFVPLMASVLLVLFQCGSEEVYFRGWLLPVLAARWGSWTGLLLSSLLFGLAHSLNHRFGPIGTVGNIMAGMLFGALSLRTGSLVAPVAAHALWNVLEANILGLTPNPGVDSLGSLFNLELIGPNFWSGGSDELNGSLACVIALTVATTAVLAATVRRGEAGRSAAAPSKIPRGPPRIGSRPRRYDR